MVSGQTMSDQSFSALDEQYRTNGWCRFSLLPPQIVFAIRNMLEAKLKQLLDSPASTLARYHDYAPPEQHNDIQWALVNIFWDANCCIEICKQNLSLLTSLIGLDLHVQNKPYLRLVRPGRPEDNIGYHRDTGYGQTPYEIMIYVPFTPLDERGSIKFVSESHVRPESYYKIVSTGAAPWPKDCKKHIMGFPYAPKKITSDMSKYLVPVPLQVGQAVMFAPSTIHGQEVNEMETTRVRVDFRVINTFAPIAIRKELGSRGYVPLCDLPVTDAAKCYEVANA